MESNQIIHDRLAYDRAMKKFKGIKSFYINLTCYCIVIPILIAVNLYFMPDHIWFYWSVIGWGIGVLIHGISVFGNGFYGEKWESQKIEQFLRTEKSQIENVAADSAIPGLYSSNVRYLRIEKRVRALGGFYKHFTIYLLVNAVILVVNYFDGEKFWSFGNWSLAIFWGFGMSMHAMGIFTDNIFLGSDWEQRKIREIMKEQSRSKIPEQR